MKHLFLDESLNHKTLALSCLVAIDEENRQKLKDILALPNPEEFGVDAFDLLYCLDGKKRKNPEYAFRRMLSAYFTEFRFQDKIREKVDSVLDELSKLDFSVYYSVYQKKFNNASESSIKAFYTTRLVFTGVNFYHDDLVKDSMIIADKGFYGISKEIVVVKSFFRGSKRTSKTAVLPIDHPDLKRPGIVFKKRLLVEPSYDRKELQLADICSGVAARALFSPNRDFSKKFYAVISGKVGFLYDNSKHCRQLVSPRHSGSIIDPVEAQDNYYRKIDSPNLLETKLFARE